MKTRNILTVILILAITSLFAQTDFSGMPYEKVLDNSQIVHTKYSGPISTAEIINVIPSPIQHIADITWVNGSILTEGYNEYQIYILDPLDGTVTKTVVTDIKRPYGLTFDGQDIWILDNTNKVIKQVDLSDGAVLSIISISDSLDTYPTGMTWVNGELWYNDAVGPNPVITGDHTHNIDVFGNAIQSFASEGDYPSGLTFDGTYLWTSDNYENLIHQIDPFTFNIIKTIEAPGGNYPNGLAWDGTHLWVSNNDADSIYQLNVNDITSKEDISQLSEVNVSVYPNPAQEVLKVNSDNDFQMEIYNTNGKLILLSSEKENNISSIEPGLYLVLIKNNNNSTIKTEKIIIL